jgi:NAD(P)-dependent dehydrogenase (short-subunit alcohol dehydrogenase family)
MTTEASAGSSARKPELLGQTVVLIGGSAGIGLKTARRARSEGADVILTGRNAERRHRSWATDSTPGEELRTTLPIGRVVRPADVAALAVHIMTNTALTGATYDIDGGQQFVA